MFLGTVVAAVQSDPCIRQRSHAFLGGRSKQLRQERKELCAFPCTLLVREIHRPVVVGAEQTVLPVERRARALELNLPLEKRIADELVENPRIQIVVLADADDALRANDGMQGHGCDNGDKKGSLHNSSPSENCYEASLS